MMKRRRAHPKWNRRFIITHEGYKIYSVDARAVRNTTQSDEEFGNSATHEQFPHLIPKDEIWIAEKSIDKEGLSYIANALASMREQDKGTPEDQAYDWDPASETFIEV